LMLSAKSAVSIACLLVCVLAARLDFHAALQSSNNRLENQECKTAWKHAMAQFLQKYLQRFLKAVWTDKGRKSDFCDRVTEFSDDVAKIMADDLWNNERNHERNQNGKVLPLLNSPHIEWMSDPGLPEDRSLWDTMFKKCVPPLSSLQDIALQEVCNARWPWTFYFDKCARAVMSLGSLEKLKLQEVCCATKGLHQTCDHERIRYRWRYRE